MNRRVLVLGALSVIVFDAVASIASRTIGFEYGAAIYGSYLIYGVTGFFAARSDGWRGAVIAGLILGFVDASVGWAVSWVIGPGRPPENVSFNAWMWPAVAITVAISATICALVGGALARLTRGVTSAAA